ncbi:MAG: hypothetical protein LBN27_11475 [Prevotellaceae bacterium]|jgi:hypothetical protein|nr:hypothetical protein [Prevotellaceae bacterium]
MKPLKRILENLLELILLVVAWLLAVLGFDAILGRSGDKWAALGLIIIIVSGWILFALSFILQSVFLATSDKTGKAYFWSKIKCFAISGLLCILYILGNSLDWEADGLTLLFLAVIFFGFLFYLIVLELIYLAKRKIKKIKKKQ